MAHRAKIRPMATIVGKRRQRCCSTKLSSTLIASLVAPSLALATAEVRDATKRPVNASNVAIMLAAPNANDAQKVSMVNQMESVANRVRAPKRNAISPKAVSFNRIAFDAFVSLATWAICAKNAMSDILANRTMWMAVASNVIATRMVLCRVDASAPQANVIARRA